MRYTRAAMLEVLTEPFMATARAKGAGRLRVLIRHGLRNALLPVVTAVGVTAAHLVAGAVVIEQVFGLPGIGQLMLNAIYHRDYTQVQATVLVITTLVVLINIVVDLSYYLLDPRISAAWLTRNPMIDTPERAGAQANGPAAGDEPAPFQHAAHGSASICRS